jgi:hypothetical protein
MTDFGLIWMKIGCHMKPNSDFLKNVTAGGLKSA